MLDIIGEFASAPPWLYRGWGYLFSKNYRDSLKTEYQRMPLPFRVLDMILSAGCFTAEVAGIFYLVYLAAF